MHERRLQEASRTEAREPREPFDNEWYDRFQKIGSFQAYEYLDGDKEARVSEKDRFMSGAVRNPSLDYPLLSYEDITRKESELLRLKTDILEQERNEVIKQAYRWRLNEKIAETRMLFTAKRGDMKAFRRYSEFIYGKPDELIFGYTIRRIRDDIRQKADHSDNPDLKILVENLLTELPTTDGNKTDFAPLPETFTKASETTREEFRSLLSIPVPETAGGKLGAEEIRSLFDEALRMIRADGWSIVIHRSKTKISVDHEHKTVKIPEHRTITALKLRKLILHELGTHVQRRLNGERTRLRLLGLGLDRNERAEEGIATMREQSLDSESIEPAGRLGYLGIGIAKGILDKKPRDFRGVYDLLRKYGLINALATGKDQESAEQLASDAAWDATVRVFRGTDCATAGTCFTKDIVYRDGNIAT